MEQSLSELEELCIPGSEREGDDHVREVLELLEKIRSQQQPSCLRSIFNKCIHKEDERGYKVGMFIISKVRFAVLQLPIS